MSDELQIDVARHYHRPSGPLPAGGQNFLLDSVGGTPRELIMHSIKSFTSNQCNRLLQTTGQFWQPESYDHWVRDDDELERIVAYINANPVAAVLVASTHAWFFGSAHDRFLHDGDTSGFLGNLS